MHGVEEEIISTKENFAINMQGQMKRQILHRRHYKCTSYTRKAEYGMANTSAIYKKKLIPEIKEKK